MAFSTDRAGSSGVESTFKTLTAPSFKYTQSVNVPPVSIAIRIEAKCYRARVIASTLRCLRYVLIHGWFTGSCARLLRRKEILWQRPSAVEMLEQIAISWRVE